MFFSQESRKKKFYPFFILLVFVARQMGFADADECPRLCKLAYDYLKRSEGCENNIYDFFAGAPELQTFLYVKLMAEFEKCILTYFAFHWSRASLFIGQVYHQFSEPNNKKKRNSTFYFLFLVFVVLCSLL
jgi:hypothetical protein